MMKKNVNLHVTFPKPYKEIPTLELLEVKNIRNTHFQPIGQHLEPLERLFVPDGKIIKVEKDFFIVRIKGVYIHQTLKVQLRLKINGKDANYDLPLQFCPACGETRDDWFKIFFLTVNAKGQPAPGVPLRICNICGCVFVIQVDLDKIQTAKSSPIIMSGKSKPTIN